MQFMKDGVSDARKKRESARSLARALREQAYGGRKKNRNNEETESPADRKTQRAYRYRGAKMRMSKRSGKQKPEIHFP